jgi:hypothetical protein
VQVPCCCALSRRSRHSDSVHLIKRFEFSKQQLSWQAAADVLGQLERLRNLVSLKLDLMGIKKEDISRFRGYLQSFFKLSAQNLKELQIFISMERLDVLDFRVPVLPYLNSLFMRLGRYEMKGDIVAIIKGAKIKRMNDLLMPFLYRQGASIHHLHLNVNYNNVMDFSEAMFAICRIKSLRSLSLDGFWSLGEFDLDESTWLTWANSERLLQDVLLKHHATIEELNLSPYNRGNFEETTIPVIINQELGRGFPVISVLKLGAFVELSDSFFALLQARLQQLKIFWINNTIIGSENLERLVAIMREGSDKLRLQNLAVCIPSQDVERLHAALALPSELEVLYIKIAGIDNSVSVPLGVL